MSTTTELLKGAAELFPGRGRHAGARTPPGPAVRRGPLRAHHAGQRLRPHQADHLRPAVAGEPERRDRPGREGGRRRRDRRRRHHRQAVHLRGRRRPQGRRAAQGARGRARHRQGRPRRLQAPVRRSRSRPSRTTTARRWAAASRSVCTARTAPSPRRCPAFSLPEVFLGLVPGWGGCALLPNLIGADRAVSVIIENSLNQNRQLKGKQVFELGHRRRALRGRGLPGAVADLDRVRAQGRRSRSSAPRSTAARPGTRPSPAAGPSPTPRCTAPPRPRTARWTSSPRPRTATCRRGFDAEDAALADLIMGGELRSGIYAFNLVQKRAKRPAGAPDKSLARPVTKVGVVGAGLMASQLALLFLRRLEVPVVLTDIDQERVDKGVGYVHAEIEKLLGKGRINQDKANRLKALVSGVAGQGRGLLRRRLHHRGRLRGDRRQAAGVRGGGGGRPGARDPRHQHLLAVGHRDGRRSCSTPSGSSASTSSTRSRSCRCWRSSAASRPTTPRWPRPSVSPRS